MWIWQTIGVVLLLLNSGTRGHPISLHNYAPTHEYKSSDYSFSYGVKDLHTGDVKHQWEKKDGDIVRGHYSVVEPDGSVRNVDYTADGKNGFNAVVKHDGPSHHPIQKPKAATSHSQVVLKPKNAAPALYDYTTLKESHTTEYQYTPQIQEEEVHVQEHLQEEEQEEKHEEENDDGEEVASSPEGHHQHYVYVPQDEYDEEPRQESIDTNIKIPYESKYKTKQTYHQQIKQTNLPIDLSLINKENSEKIIPVDVSLLNPVEIDLTQAIHNGDKFSIKNQAVEPSHQFSQNELNRFLKEYYQSGLGNVNEPYIETGFKPILSSNNNNVITQPNIPQTYKSNKKPVTTPGLRNYSTGKNKPGRIRNAHPNHYLHKREEGVLTPPKAEQSNNRYHGTSRNSGNGGQFIRYKKSITIE